MAYLSRKFEVIALLRELYFKINIFDTPLSFVKAGSQGRSSLFFGGFNPILAMKKDVVDTFKPYKSGFYLLRDVLQPVRGVANVFKGLFYAGISPVIFIFNTVR